MSKTPTWQDYLRAAMAAAGIKNAAEMSRTTGVNESQISRWLRGLGQPDLANLRKIAPALGRPMLELTVAAGHLSPDEAKMKTLQIPEAPATAAVPDAIEADDILDPVAKAHLLNQYEILRYVPRGVLRDIREQQADRRLAAVARSEDNRPAGGSEDEEASLARRAKAAVDANPHARKRRT